MDPRIFEEIRKNFKNEVIEFDWEPIRKQPWRYGMVYPIVGYIMSMLSVSLMGLGVFMWLFLIAGSILFFGGIYCISGIIEEYKEIKRGSENLWDSSEGVPRRYFNRVGFN